MEQTNTQTTIQDLHQQLSSWNLTPHRLADLLAKGMFETMLHYINSPDGVPAALKQYLDDSYLAWMMLTGT